MGDEVVIEPAIEPVVEPVVEPVKEVAKGPITQSIERPVEEPVPVVEPVIEPVIEPVQLKFGFNDKLEADDVPEELKGKSVNELIQILKQSQVQPPVQVISREQQMEELRANFYQDPIGSVAKMIELTIAPVMETMQVDKSVQAANAVSNLPDYEFLKSDIDEFMSNVPPHLKANPQSWQIAYERARGKNFDSLVEKRTVSKKKEVPPSLPAGTGSGNNNQVVSLTNEEKHAAKMMGVSEKDYARYR